MPCLCLDSNGVDLRRDFTPASLARKRCARRLDVDCVARTLSRICFFHQAVINFQPTVLFWYGAIEEPFDMVRTLRAMSVVQRRLRMCFETLRNVRRCADANNGWAAIGVAPVRGSGDAILAAS